MAIHVLRQVDVAVRPRDGLRRRDFLRGLSVAGAAALNWKDLVTLRADELRRRGRACILLWMQGGPSQFETFSPKPRHENGGQTKAISTSVPGIEIAGNFPRLARIMHDVALVRSMTSKEGSHPRATFLLHTGYLPTAAVKYPAFGSVVAQTIKHGNLDLPAFVRIGQLPNASGGGLLGTEFDPFVMAAAGQPPANTRPATALPRFERRLGLLEQLEEEYAASGAAAEVADHQKLYQQSAKMIKSPQMAAFDIQAEPEKVREAYGSSPFATGCLLARRLVESGVTFVEVVSNGWDTHADNFGQTKRLAEQVDQPFAQLVTDLKQRGLLDSTLVVWMGEFGRTPRINPRAGRDHYPAAFNVALAGGGVKGGQAIGKTDPGGTAVVDRPVHVADLFQSFCCSLKIDPHTENLTGSGRPIKIVDGGAAVRELFG